MSNRDRHLTILGLNGIAIGLIGAAVLAIGLTLWGLRSDAINEAGGDAGNIATVLAEQTARSVQSIDIVMAELKERIATFGTTPSEEFYRRLRRADVHDILKERVARLPQASVITLADKDGRVLSSSRRWPPPDIDLSDREFFQVLKANPGTKLHVAAPLPSRVTGAQNIFFSTPLVDGGGDFAGAVIVGVELTYFRKLYDSITSLRHQAFLLVRKDGTVLVRHPDPDDRVGRKVPADSPWYRLAAEGGGYYRSPGYFDGIPRLVAVRSLPDYPLVVNVAIVEATALSNWQRRATLIGIGTLLAVFCSVFLLKQLSKQFRRLLDSQASLAEREARLAEKSQELERANLRIDAALNNMSQGLCMFDRDERLVICNDQYLEMYGLSPEIVKPGCTLRDLLEHRKAAGNFSGDVDQYIADLRAQVARKDGKPVIVHLNDGRVTAVQNQPTDDGGWVATHEDITERQRAQARIAHMARHDALTDLANRVLFKERMDEALARLRERGDRFSIFVFDLDLFKAVNDSLGHPVGDALLKAIAKRLMTGTRDGDTIGRLGGDEFAILQSVEGDQTEAAHRLANRLMETIAAPYSIDGHRIVIGISLGIALAPDHGIDADQLLKNADLALYRAKSEGRNGYRFFERAMDDDARLRHTLEIDLRNAVSRNEFELHYQTVVNIATRETCGVEALIRWRHPRHGLIPPDRFIPLAEEIGMIIPLGEWIMRQACMDAAASPEHIKLAVNLSPVQFRTGNLVDVVTEALVASGLSPERLELEITESVLLQKDAGNLAVLHQLKSLGVWIVLDDFGTGYSSLSYLRLFPFDKIKIDRSFVAELSSRPDCAAIVCAVTGLGRSLQIETTGEGVETQEQLELLRAAGCTQAQGYLFSRPIPVRELDFGNGQDRGTGGHAA
jgi:diguanylate cyclase (GGDEF)-like protein/PAS domain S-box-containing protein